MNIQNKTTIISFYFLLLLLTSCGKQQEVVEALPFKISGNNHWGLISTNGSFLTINAYESRPTPVVGGLFGIQDDKARWQLYSVNQSTVPVSVSKYVQVGHFFEEVTLAQEEPGAPFLIVNKQGKEINRIDRIGNHPVALAHNFCNGLALICTDELKYGYINAKGEIQIEPIYDMAFDFSDNLALVGRSNPEGQIAWRVIDKQGNIKFPVSLTDSRISEGYSCSLLTYRDMKRGYCGALDTTGKIVFRLQSDIKSLLPYTNGVAICVAMNGVGLVNSKGEILIQPNYENAKIIAPDRVAFQWKGKWALFDFGGKPLTEFVYDDIFESFHSESMFVCQDGIYCLMDNQGKIADGNRYEMVYTDAIISRHTPQIFLRYPEKSDDVKVQPSTIVQPVEQVEKQDVPSRKTEGLTHIKLVKEISKESPFYETARQIMSAGLSEDDLRNRQLILDYVEHFRMAYITKDIDFLKQVFSDKALIIVGKVVKETSQRSSNLMSEAQVVYNIRSKNEYLTRLKAVFAANKKIEVSFKDFNIRRHPTQDGFYGVSLRQGYRSDLYSDEGYLFLLWDFRDKQKPLIHVRTWQPTMLDEGVPLPAQEIFNLGSFNLQ